MHKPNKPKGRKKSSPGNEKKTGIEPGKLPRGGNSTDNGPQQQKRLAGNQSPDGMQT